MQSDFMLNTEQTYLFIIINIIIIIIIIFCITWAQSKRIWLPCWALGMPATLHLTTLMPLPTVKFKTHLQSEKHLNLPCLCLDLRQIHCMSHSHLFCCLAAKLHFILGEQQWNRFIYLFIFFFWEKEHILVVLGSGSHSLSKLFTADAEKRTYK